MPSFDIVSEVDMVEVKNAVDNANRELSTRFDFRGVEATFTLQDDAVTLAAEGDFQIKQMMDMLRNALAKRNVDTNVMDPQDNQISGKNHRKVVKFQQGIDQATAKKLVKLIKDSKIKVQTAIQGEQLRVTGKKRDDLQQVMAQVKQADLGQPFQFNNFRD
ncbi:YajQ family cyclic di-GMP-binding protein [Aestuariibacter halophilus]|uniref:Nucleotide-binding protein LJ739_11820 n=1 Tax=Fluctibacter halophilus TaxID=226011 RepID=A0ABS8GB26_9ALTE|nr:YajQ family cyclic di-GMP-binding protein [Aestuariibacter halophilus]MCC2616929.1 YajQ family cyclic di-GMP-binding protein [Aestuariibacter halophilus]